VKEKAGKIIANLREWKEAICPEHGTEEGGTWCCLETGSVGDGAFLPIWKTTDLSSNCVDLASEKQVMSPSICSISYFVWFLRP